MLGKGKIFIYTIFAVLGLSASVEVNAQVPGSEEKARALVEKGDSLRAIYRFEESLDVYEEALELTITDSLLIQDKILMSENGRSMMGFVDIPNVVARQRFSLDDFFLYYPLPDRSWRSLPNQLDSVAGHELVRATFIPDP